MMKNKTLKRTLARIALILILLVILLLVYGAVTHNSGLIMLSLFCLIVLPVVVYLFLKLAGLLRDYSSRDGLQDPDPK